MNNQLMEILNVIQDGLRGPNREHNRKSPADSICTNLGGTVLWGCHKNGNWECADCPIGYSNSKGYATQIIQVFKNI